MGDHPDRKGAAREETLGGVSRRTFIQACSSLRVTSVGALGTSNVPLGESATTVLTVDQANRLSWF